MGGAPHCGERVIGLRVLYASERPPYPFFLGGAARCAHRLLSALRRDFEVSCCAIGSARYSATSWAFPPASEYEVLGIRTADEEARVIDCGYPVRLLEDVEQD